MKLFKTSSGPVLVKDGSQFLLSDEWDDLVNDDALYQRLSKVSSAKTDTDLLKGGVLAPIGDQEIWAAGVTYYRSKVGRQEESKDAGGGDFYARVYEARRPELFFKSPAYRAVGPEGKVRVRKDSTWDVPEPELTLVISRSGKIIGYTVGNDMSSRSIEGENPLYLPQAKCYDGSASVGPCILVTDKPLSPDTAIVLEISRGGSKVFEGRTEISQIKRGFEELVSFLYLETTFSNGCLLMTGTGIVPPSDFTLQSKDEIRITIDTIGTLVNTVE